MPKKEKEKERRKVARVQVPMVGRVTYETKDEGSRTVQVVAQDISEEGAYLVASNCPAVGDRTKISLRCDSGFKQMKISLEAVGTVTRVDESDGKQNGFAVEFQVFSDVQTGRNFSNN
jgi:hypothetical protein